MSNADGKPGRKIQSGIYRKIKLSSDAKIMWALYKGQPKTKKELEAATGVKGSTFYRMTSFLKEKNILLEVDGMYALAGFDFLDKTLEDAFHRSLAKQPFVDIPTLVQAACMPWREIESASYRIAKKLGLTPAGLDTEYFQFLKL